MKTAQVVAEDIVESAYEAMTVDGDEFDPASFILTAARDAASVLAEVLAPLSQASRAMVVDLAVEPTRNARWLDSLLGGIATILHAFAQRFTLGDGTWACVRNYGCAYLESRVVAWQAADGHTQLHLLDTDVPTPDDLARTDEVRDIFAAMARVFGSATLTLYPARCPAQARLYVAHDKWHLLSKQGEDSGYNDVPVLDARRDEMDEMDEDDAA
ncbi:hypothetical protein [Nocardioides aurantiacus]|uniref:Uncharacterized protein n=1 Tax=Nocardioides aurantiacus TaxID=86796 RepID=A0A3N2CTX9_9ACTN|nr:hypothetical protein [Nocardioides aurantiacus]ROR90977.1 hypothetical protein EDD33_1834 [Nocardioides aurantiacus]